MKLNLATALGFAAAGLACIVIGAQEVVAQALKCDIGPIVKAYGSTQWLVYSCHDGKSVVILSAPAARLHLSILCLRQRIKDIGSTVREMATNRFRRLP